MSFRDCIEDAVTGGVLDRQQAEELYKKARDYEQTYRLDMQHSPESAERLGQLEAIKGQKRQTRHQRYQAAKQAILNTQNARHIRGHKNGSGAGLGALLGRDFQGRAGYSNVDFRAKAILGDAHSRFAEALSALRTTALGLKQDKALLREVVREVHGTASGNPQAAQIADLWRETAEVLRQRFNRAGGNIPQRLDWGMPQTHDHAVVASFGRAEWLADVHRVINRQAMTNADGAVLSAGELELLLQDVFETISTDGLNKLVPGTQGGSKLANRRQEHRVLVFKDGDAWLEYAEKYGKPDLFAVMTDHMQAMAHDTALLEILGPNPNAAFRYLEDITLKDGASARVRGYNESLFRTVNGNVERNASVWLADFSDAVRGWLVAAKLGSATLSAVSDVGFVAATANWNGLPMANVMGRMLTQLNPANEADRIMATQMGLTAMQWSNALQTVNRYSSVTGRGVSGKAAEFTIRASGLSAWSDAWKRGFGMEMYANLGRQSDLAFDALEPKTRSAFDAYGIDASMWDDLRRPIPFEHDGARFLSIGRVMDDERLPLGRRQEIVSKVQEMVLTEINFAIPEPDARARVITSGAIFGQGARGSYSGEGARGMFQFKGFPVSAIMLHVYRAINAKGGPVNPLAYAAQTMIATTLLGALALQLKEISRGKNPRPVNDGKFWAAAAVQGGGLGIYGDFLFTDVNRFGGGLTSTVAGPFTDLIDDTAKLTIGQLWDVAGGKDTKFAAEAVDYARRYTPAGSLWYSRLLFEREVLDQLQLMSDREAPASFHRRQQKRKRDYDQTYWWKSGEVLPSEAPQLKELIK